MRRGQQCQQMLNMEDFCAFMRMAAGSILSATPEIRGSELVQISAVPASMTCELREVAPRFPLGGLRGEDS
jgi:hypothetical protein